MVVLGGLVDRQLQRQEIPIVILRQPASLGDQLLEDLIHAVIEERHGGGGETQVWVELLQDLGVIKILRRIDSLPCRGTWCTTASYFWFSLIWKYFPSCHFVRRHFLIQQEALWCSTSEISYLDLDFEE